MELPISAGGTLPPGYLRFFELFNRGEFWESHEALEGPWRATRSDFYQGLILLASAYVHVQRGNPRGVAAQLRKAELRLAPYPSPYLGLDLAGLRAHIRSGRARVEPPDSVLPATLGRRVPSIHLAPEQLRIRGDERELRTEARR